VLQFSNENVIDVFHNEPTILQLLATACQGSFVVYQCHAVLDASLTVIRSMSVALFEVAEHPDGMTPLLLLDSIVN